MKRAKMMSPWFLLIGLVVLAASGPLWAVLPEGLVAYYKLDSVAGSTAIDETGTHDGTLTGALAWVAGKDGNALQFVGGNGSPFVNLDAWQTDGPAGLGLAIWAKWNGDNGLYQGLISQRDGTMYWWTEISPGGGQLRFKSNTSPQSNLYLTGEHLVVGEWTHYACSHDAALGTGAVYLNGEEVLTGDWSLPGGDFSGLRTGIGVVNTADGLGTFYGTLDEAMIFNRPLTPEDIASAMQGFADPTASGRRLPRPAPLTCGVTWFSAGVRERQPSHMTSTSVPRWTTSAIADRSNPSGVLVSEAQDVNTFDPDGLLELGQTYYWRVDEVNGAPDNTIFPGLIWSFTAEAAGVCRRWCRRDDERGFPTPAPASRIRSMGSGSRQ